MTEKRYFPEGSLICTPENVMSLASLSSLERAFAEGRILEGIASSCDCADMSLKVDLGVADGIIPREEAVYNRDGSTAKDIAIITRVGKPVCFKIKEIREAPLGRPTVILSRREAQLECSENYICRLSPGDIIPTKVTHLEPFGAFVDIGCGIVSLMTVDCLSVSRISHPKDRISAGDLIPAIVKSVEADTGRIYMTHRELLGTWEENAALFHPCETVTGIIRSVEEYGVFVELMPNLAGLAEAKDGVQVGDACSVYIKSIVPEKMKVKLVLIDTYPSAVLPRERYFIDTEKITHISRWTYSPKSSSKLIETVFD